MPTLPMKHSSSWLFVMAFCLPLLLQMSVVGAEEEIQIDKDGAKKGLIALAVIFVFVFIAAIFCIWYQNKREERQNEKDRQFRRELDRQRAEEEEEFQRESAERRSRGVEGGQTPEQPVDDLIVGDDVVVTVPTSGQVVIGKITALPNAFSAMVDSGEKTTRFPRSCIRKVGATEEDADVEEGGELPEMAPIDNDDYSSPGVYT